MQINPHEMIVRSAENIPRPDRPSRPETNGIPPSISYFLRSLPGSRMLGEQSAIIGKAIPYIRYDRKP
jgi:hypothetical protein